MNLKKIHLVSLPQTVSDQLGVVHFRCQLFESAKKNVICKRVTKTFQIRTIGGTAYVANVSIFSINVIEKDVDPPGEDLCQLVITRGSLARNRVKVSGSCKTVNNAQSMLSKLGCPHDQGSRLRFLEVSCRYGMQADHAIQGVGAFALSTAGASVHPLRRMQCFTNLFQFKEIRTKTTITLFKDNYGVGLTDCKHAFLTISSALT